MPDSYDTPDTEEVLQADQENFPTVPVEVQNVVRIDEMPTETAFRTIIIDNEQLPFKLVNADPRRKRVIIWLTATGTDSGIFIGKQEQIQTGQGDGAWIPILATSPLKIEFCDKDEIWVRPGDFSDSAGSWTGWVTASSDIILSMIVENWAR